MTAPDDPTPHVPTSPPFEPRDAEPYYFAVSLPKLAVMSLASFGLYHLLWHYRNWQRYRARSTRRFSVLLRALLGPLFAFRLFERVQHDLREAGQRGIPEPGLLALAYLALNALLSLPTPWWALAFLNTAPLLIVQAGANRLHRVVAPRAPRNDSYSGANVVLIIVGVFFFLLMLIGLFLDVPDAPVPDAVPVDLSHRSSP